MTDKEKLDSLTPERQAKVKVVIDKMQTAQNQFDEGVKLMGDAFFKQGAVTIELYVDELLQEQADDQAG